MMAEPDADDGFISLNEFAALNTTRETRPPSKRACTICIP
jgi:hypothetical protein